MQRPTRLVAGALILGTGMLGLGTGSSHAATTYCRTDPIVTLSTGAQLNITDSVSTTSSSIKAISYTVHIPSGESVTKIVYTSGMSGKEKLSWVADQSSKTYDVSTYVTTGSGVSMSMQVNLLNGSGNKAGSGSASGTTNATLTTGFSGTV